MDIVHEPVLWVGTSFAKSGWVVDAPWSPILFNWSKHMMNRRGNLKALALAAAFGAGAGAGAEPPPPDPAP